MLSRRRRARSAVPTETARAVVWTREKMLALLAGAVVLAVVFALGLVLAVVQVLHGPDSTGAGSPVAGGPGNQPAADRDSVGAGQPAEPASGTSVRARQDALVARPMMAAPPTAARPSPVSLADPGPPLVLPRSTRSGPAGVPTGFDQSPPGALAQLAAIDESALSSGSLTGAREVITGWAAPGGPSVTSWSGVHAMAGLLDAAKVPAAGSVSMAVNATALMGQVKGTVGEDFVVVCVDLQLEVTMTSTARGAAADCQRMLWSAGRWLIGPGPEPAQAPSIWPGTDLAISAGWRDLRRTGPGGPS